MPNNTIIGLTAMITQGSGAGNITVQATKCQISYSVRHLAGESSDATLFEMFKEVPSTTTFDGGGRQKEGQNVTTTPNSCIRNAQYSN